MKRQNVRKLILLLSLLLFPVTMWYFSPAIISMAFMQHVLNGSFFVFLAMLVLSPFLGRLFCGWLCPAGGLQECIAVVNSKPARAGRRNAIKYVIFGIWVALLALCWLIGNGTLRPDFFFMTDHGVSVTQVFNYITYYGVLSILFLPALIHGRRATCHYMCWMAPFMQFGAWVGQKLHLPQVHISKKAENCIACHKCSAVCPMGLDVTAMVREGKAYSAECIACGACVDTCPRGALHFSMRPEKAENQGAARTR